MDTEETTPASRGELELVCQAIQRGQAPPGAEFGALLGAATAERRFEVNNALARACFSAGDIASAATFADRALLLSGLSEKFLLFYIELQGAAGNVAAQRAAYKTMGMRYAAAGDTYSALRNFNLHRDAYALAGQGNRYEYDFDVLAAVERMAATQARRPSRREGIAGRRIRLAYLVFHVHHPESVIVKLLCEFAKWHDHQQFELVFFVAESSLNNNEIANKNLEALRQAGARIVQADKPSVIGCLLQIRDQAAAFRPDVFIGAAILAEYAHYFALLAAPATARVGLVYGPPELYIAPSLHWVVASSDTLMLGSPVGGSVIPIEYALPERERVVPRTRSSLGIAENAVVLVSAGRPTKFMDKDFWHAIVQALELHPSAVFVAMGLDVDPPFLADLLPAQLESRVIRLGWQAEYLGILVNADIVVDTYPSGSGIVLLDAMAFGIPVVSFRHDYTRPYDQMNWNLGEELVVIPELLIERYQLDSLRDLLSSLIQDPARRARLGQACQAIAFERRSSPARYVQKHEAVYRDVLLAAQQRHAANGSLRSIVKRLLGRLRRRH